MLETLLNHFQSYGLTDLEFIIVNSKLSHSQDRLHELQKRVSFAVYQETEEEQVWNLMEGGKDDMYIYDRCGRLTFYVPFPLSMINETPVVANAILTTYFRSPCGDSCGNKTVELEEFINSLEKTAEPSNETQQDNETYVGTEMPGFGNETLTEMHVSNDLLSAIGPVNEEIDVSNSSHPSNMTDYDYPEYDISNGNITNNTNTENAKSYFNSIYKLFFNNEKTIEEKPATNETAINETITNSFYNNSSDHNDTHEHENHKHNIHHSHHKNEHKHELKERKKSDRCLEADYQVCKSWTKRRLLHAQKCCSNKQTEVETTDPKSCQHFGKKRCKKIQSILKCCIKTVYIENSSDVSLSETKVSPVEESVTKSEKEPKHEETATIQTSHVVCCKPAEDGKLCRVINSGNCGEGEYIESSPKDSK